MPERRHKMKKSFGNLLLVIGSGLAAYGSFGVWGWLFGMRPTIGEFGGYEIAFAIGITIAVIGFLMRREWVQRSAEIKVKEKRGGCVCNHKCMSQTETSHNQYTSSTNPNQHFF